MVFPGNFLKSREREREMELVLTRQTTFQFKGRRKRGGKNAAIPFSSYMPNANGP